MRFKKIQTQQDDDDDDVDNDDYGLKAVRTSTS